MTLTYSGQLSPSQLKDKRSKGGCVTGFCTAAKTSCEEVNSQPTLMPVIAHVIMPPVPVRQYGRARLLEHQANDCLYP